MGARTSHLRFAMPASQGALRASTLSLQLGPWLRKVLAPELTVEMHVAESYAALAADLREGRVDLAWAPPLVCVQVEREGGRGLVQFERGGATTFRAAFVCRASQPLELHSLAGVSVAWVDKESAAGYLLPCRYLQDTGLDLARAFSSELFAGSFAAALEALLSGKVSLTTVFASAASAAPMTGLDRLPPALRDQLRIIGYSGEAPNDGIVASAALPEPTFQLVRARLTASHVHPDSRAGVRSIFDADRMVASASTTRVGPEVSPR